MSTQDLTDASTGTTRPDDALTHAQSFVSALSDGDFARLEEALEHEAYLSALLPDGFREWHGAAEIARVFAGWFGEVDELTAVSASVSRLGPCVKLHWRLRVRAERLAEVPVLVEQQVFADAGPTSRIQSMSLLCSGFVRDPLHA